jgi:hypothetical protein
MRNRWFPFNVARYAVGDELKSIKLGKVNVERDSEFEAVKHRAQLAQLARLGSKEAIEAAKKEAKAQRNAASALAAAAAAKRAAEAEQLSVRVVLEHSCV